MSTEQPKQTVKVTHCGQTKRTEFAQADLTYERLCEWLTTAFGVTVNGTTPPIPRLVYRDPEGDIVSVSSTSELLDAVRLVAKSGVLVLQLSFPRPRDRWYRFAATGGFGNLDGQEAVNDAETPAEANEAQETNMATSTENPVPAPSVTVSVNPPSGRKINEEAASRRAALVAWRTAVAEARQNGTELPPHPFLGMEHPVHHRFAAMQAKRTARVAARAARAHGPNANSATPSAPSAEHHQTEYVPNSQPLLAYPVWAPCTSTAPNSGETGAGISTGAAASSDRMLLFVPSLGKVFAPISLASTPGATVTENVVAARAIVPTEETASSSEPKPMIDTNIRGRRATLTLDERKRFRQQNSRFSVSIEPATSTDAPSTEGAQTDAFEARRQMRIAKKTARLAKLG